MSGRRTRVAEGQEQPTGRRAPGDDRIAVLLRKLAETREATLELARSMEDAARREPPSVGEWSVHQQLAHLAEMEEIWLSWARRIVARPGIDVGDEGPTPTPSVDTAAAQSFQELEDRLREARGVTLRSIERLTTEELERTGRHRWFGPMSALQCLRAIYRHDRVHQDQMQGLETTFRFPSLPPYE